MSIKNKTKNKKNDIRGVKTEFKKQTQEIKSEFKKQTKIILRHFNVLKEDFDSQVGLIAEQHGSINDKLDQHTAILDQHTAILGGHTEMIGSLKEDMEIVKQDISFIKHGLTQKVDGDEFVVLEKRVSSVESKLQKTLV